MNALLRAVAVVFTVFLAGCGSGLPGISVVTAEAGPKVVITNSRGGDVDSFDQAFLHWSQMPGATVEIQQGCASACTQVFDYFPPDRVCLAPGARVLFHSATLRTTFASANLRGSQIATVVDNTDSIGTFMMFLHYPQWIQYRLRSAGVMVQDSGNPRAILGADEFWMHGYRVCERPKDEPPKQL